MKEQIKQLSLLTACLAFYIEDCMARGQSNSTVNTKNNLVLMFIRWALIQGIERIQDIDLYAMEDYRKYVSAYRKPKNNEPLSIVTQSQRLIALTTFLDRMFYYDIITDNFFAKFELPRTGRRLPKFVPDEEQVELIINQALVKGKIGIRDRAIIEMFYASGIRRNELANLDIRHVDAKKLTVTVRKGKGSYDRTVPIVQRTIDALNDYLENVRPELATFESGDALFLGMTGKRILSSKLTELVGDYVRRSGVSEDGACHVLRYATGTHMLENGADIRVVQEQLGHEDISSTQLYALVSIKHLKKVHAKTHPFSNKRSPQ